MAIESGSINISYDCSELISELKEDIAEFGENEIVYAWKRQRHGEPDIYVNYDFKTSYKEIEEAKERSEIIEIIKMGELLKILEKQNSIL